MEYEFSDKWSSMEDYTEFIKNRIRICEKTLKKTGSIFVHCDRRASHHIRIILDEIFGVDNFQNEIIWSYRRWSNSKKGLMNAHQTILFYSKCKDFKYNSTYEKYSPTTNLDQIFQKRKRDENGK